MVPLLLSNVLQLITKRLEICGEKAQIRTAPSLVFLSVLPMSLWLYIPSEHASARILNWHVNVR